MRINPIKSQGLRKSNQLTDLLLCGYFKTCESNLKTLRPVKTGDCNTQINFSENLLRSPLNLYLHGWILLKSTIDSLDLNDSGN